MTAIGAVAGFAAQNAAFVAARSSAKPLPQNALVEATAGTEKYYFGDFINGHLLQQPNGAKYPVWSIVAAAALEAGVQESDLPDLTEIFRHVAGSVGKPTFGVLRTPEGHPTHLSPRQALDLFWPRVKFILSRTDGPGPAKGESVAPEHWPLVIALVARQYLLMGKDTLDPRISLKLMMESAIAMSKVDPKTVPQTEPDAPGDARQ